MTLDIYQVDAFASEVFKGNPAAVVPLQEWISAETMQQIAMENNLSETAFFIRNSSPASDESFYHLRWFTPEYEIDLCGHATLATAFVIKNYVEEDAQQLTFSTEKAGELKVYITGDDFTLDFPSRMPQPCDVPEMLLQSVGLKSAKEVLRSRDYFIVAEDEAQIRSLQPDYELMKQLDTIGVIVTARGQSADVVSRCFYPGAGIPEDPVTGSAHCNIVSYWYSKTGKTKLFCKQLSPRGGDLNCELKNDRVLMTGKCVKYLEGKIHLS